MVNKMTQHLFTDHDTFLFYSKVTEIDSLHMSEDVNRPKPPIKNPAHTRNVIGLAVDYPNKRVFFSDIQLSNIQAATFDKDKFTFTSIVECKFWDKNGQSCCNLYSLNSK